MGCEPEHVVRLAMERARQKYGGEQDWAAWHMRAEPVPATAGLPLRFTWRDGKLWRV